MSSLHNSPFTSVVLAGGGNRCFWQAGFWTTAAPAIGLAPEVVTGVIAGATFACAILADQVETVLRHMKKVLAANRRNFYPGRLLTKDRVCPHYNIYRQAILEFLDNRAVDRLRQGPEIRVLLTRPPRWAGPYLAVTLGFLAYTVERYLNNPLHPVYAGRLGFVPEVVSART
ncbi:MAG: patatin-like phospholipase family protein, partial [Deltaproteobacteria bacterium]|nr:patatin-like phospholipase family protein [Deltaproteobacteria bacterium]